MIISHKHKFIFIKTEKTAGTSIEIALSKICGPEDIITPISPADELKRKEFGFRGAQNYLVPFSKYTPSDWFTFLLKWKRAKFYNHISAAAIRNWTQSEVWNSYFKFCFERDPWDKAVSLYYWNSQYKPYASIEAFIACGDAGKIKGFDLYTNGGIPVVDMIGKYETMEQDLLKISGKLNLTEPLTLTPYKAKGDVRKDKSHYSQLLSREAAEQLANIFAREIRIFGYTFKG